MPTKTTKARGVPRKPAPAPTGSTPAEPAKNPQISIRVDAELLARITRCADDAHWHGGATVSVPVLLRKALGTYLTAYEESLRDQS